MSIIMWTEIVRDENGKISSKWEGGETVVAEAYDVPSQC